MTGRLSMKSRRYAWFFACLLLSGFLFSASAGAADDSHPLRPVDTTSPRESLRNFVTHFDAGYTQMHDVMTSHMESGRLYLNKDERRKQREVFSIAKAAVRSLDFSGVLPILQQTVPIERAIQLKEILDRIEVPAFDDIPDRAAMERNSTKKWRLPDTEIDFGLIEDGPRAGSYVVTAETVHRLPEFYERVKHLPYKPGPAKELNDMYRAMSGNQDFTNYDAYTSSPIGLDRLIPPRWMMSLPDWTKTRIVGVTVWQWLDFVAALLVVCLAIFGLRRLAHRFARSREDGSGLFWPALVTPLLVILAAAFVMPMVCTILRISGIPLIVTVFAQTAVLYISAAWLSFVGSGIIGEAIADSEHLSRRRLDSQLVRLGTRFAGIVVAIGFLIQGANELGFPAYSVIAGLGVGGVAVALAARDSLANLFGSMLIMFEKPFRVGDTVRISGSEGTVEDVGFRSTRIRTLDNSLVSIPNNTVVNATIENLAARVMRRQRFFLQITYDTDREKVEEFAARIEQLLVEHPVTNKGTIRVRFNEFGESSLNILVYFYLEVRDITTELKEREDILFQIMEIARKLGVEFAFPTRTLQVVAATAPVEFEGARVAAR
jgi:MscS family membrane protein